MPTAASDPFANFKAVQREAWSAFAPVETITTTPAAKLVKFAQVTAGQRVLDVGCGTGVVAVTAARRGAKVSGLDLTPALIERARKNTAIAGVDIDLREGDAEALPYPDGSFDVVLSQFGHMFAPRPAVVVGEMLRVLKPGGIGMRLEPGIGSASRTSSLPNGNELSLAPAVPCKLARTSPTSKQGKLRR